MNNFKQITPEEISDNLFRLISKDWMLITAGDKNNYNMMTASWGGMGYLWNKNICFLFIRHSRYTYEFTERLDSLSLNFFTEEYRDALTVCGRKSGRDFNKMKDCALTPISLSNGGVAFAEARMIMNCKKLSDVDVDKFDFSDKSVLKNYADGDYHKMYIYEIKEVFKK